MPAIASDNLTINQGPVESRFDAMSDAVAAQHEWFYKILNTDRLTSINSGDFTPSNASDTLCGIATLPEIASITPTPISVDTEHEEEFGGFQSASADALKQSVFAVDEFGEDDSLLSHTDPDLVSITITAFGLVEPVSVRHDTSTQYLRRVGKLALRKLNLARETATLKKVTALLNVRQGPQIISADDQVDGHLAYDALKEPRDVKALETVQNEVGIVRSVVFASPLVSEEETAVQLDCMLEEEKTAWND
jgi:hypothetical protein